MGQVDSYNSCVRACFASQYQQMFTHMVLARWAKLVFWIIVCCDYRCHCRSADGSPPDSFPRVLSFRRSLRGSAVQDPSDLDRLSSLTHVPQNVSTSNVGFPTTIGIDPAVRPLSYTAAAVSWVLDGVHTTMLDLVIFTCLLYTSPSPRD